MIDFSDYLKHLGSEKFRSIILCHNSTIFLSEFSYKLAQNFNGKYLNLVDYFKKNNNSENQLTTFGLEKFAELLKMQANGQDLLVVDHLGLVLNTWRKKEVQGFYRLVENQWNSFLSPMRATLIFCMYSSNEIKDINIKDSTGESRIRYLSEFKDL